LLMGLASSC